MLNEKLIKKTALELQQPEQLVHKVIYGAYKSLNKASKDHSELEIPGFGVLLLSRTKIRKRIAKYTSAIEMLKQKEQTPETLQKIENCHSAIAYYKTRLDDE